MAKWQRDTLDSWLISAKEKPTILACSDPVVARLLRSALYPRRQKLGLTHIELSLHGDKVHLTPVVFPVVLE